MTKAQGCKNRIRWQLSHVRKYADGLTNTAWEGTFWKNKKAVREALRMAQADLNILYDELDEITGKKNKREMI